MASILKGLPTMKRTTSTTATQHGGARGSDLPAAPGALHASSQAARLLDGRQVVIREATTADLAGIMDFFERLSTLSRYSRVLSPQPRLRRELIARIVAGGPDRLSVLAQPAGFSATTRNIVAVGGWVEAPAKQRAEISVAVADAWQGNALGTYVALILLRAAFAGGHTRFAAELLGADARMLSLMQALGASARTHREDDVLHIEFELPAAGAPGSDDSASASRDTPGHT